MPRCFQASCSTLFKYTGINVTKQVIFYITSHLLFMALECYLQNRYLCPIENYIKLSLHLFQDYSILYKLTLLTSIYFCYKCSLQVELDLNWANYCSGHFQNPPIFYGLIYTYRIITIAGRCLFCFSQLKYQQFLKPHYFNIHIN